MLWWLLGGANYNDAVTTIPSSLLARLVGFSGRDYFQAEERSRHTPEVKW